MEPSWLRMQIRTTWMQRVILPLSPPHQHPPKQNNTFTYIYVYAYTYIYIHVYVYVYFSQGLLSSLVSACNSHVNLTEPYTLGTWTALGGLFCGVWFYVAPVDGSPLGSPIKMYTYMCTYVYTRTHSYLRLNRPIQNEGLFKAHAGQTYGALGFDLR